MINGVLLAVSPWRVLTKDQNNALNIPSSPIGSRSRTNCADSHCRLLHFQDYETSHPLCDAYEHECFANSASKLKERGELTCVIDRKSTAVFLVPPSSNQCGKQDLNLHPLLGTRPST